jgi:transposase
MTKRSTMVGLDVHKESIEVVTAEPGAEGEVRHFGKIGADLASVDRMVKQLRGSGKRLHFVYEAGPCGFHLYRHLSAQGLECAMVSPSMTPKRSGDRIKTHRRDAEALARLHRTGELRAI